MRLDGGRSDLWSKESAVTEIGKCMDVITAAPGYQALVVTVYDGS